MRRGRPPCGRGAVRGTSPCTGWVGRAGRRAPRRAVRGCSRGLGRAARRTRRASPSPIVRSAGVVGGKSGGQAEGGEQRVVEERGHVAYLRALEVEHLQLERLEVSRGGPHVEA